MFKLLKTPYYLCRKQHYNKKQRYNKWPYYLTPFNYLYTESFFEIIFDDLWPKSYRSI
jgi:hypothetical protein